MTKFPFYRSVPLLPFSTFPFFTLLLISSNRDKEMKEINLTALLCLYGIRYQYRANVVMWGTGKVYSLSPGALDTDHQTWICRNHVAENCGESGCMILSTLTQSSLLSQSCRRLVSPQFMNCLHFAIPHLAKICFWQWFKEPILYFLLVCKFSLPEGSVWMNIWILYMLGALWG